jgi:hypothetical protein
MPMISLQNSHFSYVFNLEGAFNRQKYYSSTIKFVSDLGSADYHVLASFLQTLGLSAETKELREFIDMDGFISITNQIVKDSNLSGVIKFSKADINGNVKLSVELKHKSWIKQDLCSEQSLLVKLHLLKQALERNSILDSSIAHTDLIADIPDGLQQITRIKLHKEINNLERLGEIISVVFKDLKIRDTGWKSDLVPGINITADIKPLPRLLSYQALYSTAIRQPTTPRLSEIIEIGTVPGQIPSCNDGDKTVPAKRPG